MITSRRLLAIAMTLFAVMAALALAGVSARTMSALVACLAVVAVLAVTTGWREVTAAVDAMPVSEAGPDAAIDEPAGGAISAAATSAAAHESGRRFRTFDALIDVPAFRWYLLSQVGNQSAQLMQMVVRGFLAYQLTGSFAALGLVELAAAGPRVLLALYGGVVADRAARRVIVQIGQALNASIAAILATLLFMGILRFEHLVFGALAQGVLNSFVMPARQAMIPEVVGTSRLMNAFALNQLVMNILRMGAPALAGLLIFRYGGGWVFAVMSGLFLFALFTLFMVPKVTAADRAAALARAGGNSARGQSRTGGREIMEAVAYLRGQPILYTLLGLHCIVGILALPYQRLLPGFVDQVLSGGEHSRTAILMGLLLSFTAVGALVGSLLIASLPNRERGKLLIGSLVFFAIGLFAFAVSSTFWLSAGIVMILGVGQAGRQSLIQILVQSYVSDEYRGRVSSIIVLEDGIESFGIFLIALLAEYAGPQVALGIVAIAIALLSGWMWSARRIRELQ